MTGPQAGLRDAPLTERLSGWYQLLGPQPVGQPLRDHISADFAVVGAGFTGLAAARQLAAHAPGARVVVVESQRVGMGSSGRNSGFLVDLAHYNHHLSTDDHCVVTRLQRAGIAHLAACVQAYDIDCEWSAEGRLHAAAGPVGTRALARFCTALDAMGESYSRLSRSELREITGTDYYASAVHTPGAVLVQPAALVVGLRTCLPSNVDVYDESAVRSVRFENRRGARLVTDHGSVTAPAVVVAVNGCSSELRFPETGRVFPMLTFASLSAPPPDGTGQSPTLAGRASWGVVCEDPMGSTIRRTRGGRILVRNSLRFGRRATARDAAAVVAVHRRSFGARFPELAAVGLEYTWGGTVGVTANHVPYFGQVRPGVYTSAGCNGVGMTLGTISGVLLADMAAGVDCPLLADLQRLPRPAFVPPRVLLEPIVRASVRWRQSRIGADC
ncbi:MAG TPA: FAD-binding oxidoreductase [Acidimicrobiales bacterium]|nr:FAD-binding oxidoreductase [Acidimicrobiales bacterium]